MLQGYGTPDIRSSLLSLCKLNPNIIEPFKRIAFSKLKEGIWGLLIRLQEKATNIQPSIRALGWCT